MLAAGMLAARFARRAVPGVLFRFAAAMFHGETILVSTDGFGFSVGLMTASLALQGAGLLAATQFRKRLAGKRTRIA